MGNRPNFSREVKLQWAGSRERNLASGRGRTFFLTSLFIELIDPGKGEQKAQSCDIAWLQHLSQNKQEKGVSRQVIFCSNHDPRP
jgi:hypothetical protein